MSLINKHIVLGISGGIAAYKCPDLVRQLKKKGAEVRVVMTESAKHFVSELSLQAVSGNKVSESLFDSSAELSMGHIELAKWADLILIAPSTANIIAKLAHGIADDLLSTLCLATTAPIAIAPAMNQQMYQAVVTQKNLSTLIERGCHIFGPDKGEQACGDVGLGRMLEPSKLVDHILALFMSKKLERENTNNQDLSGINIVITAGPTQEELDPVRYITNYSSGKMGFAIAKIAADMGASVSLISGPVNLDTPKNVTRYNVKSANQMNEQSQVLASSANIFIACAAVADYRAKFIADHKIKKHDENNELILTLIKNPDIVAGISAMTENRPFVVGFAAETNNIEEYALKKLHSKNLDMICANDVSSNDQGFNTDNNAVTIYWKSGKESLPLMDKHDLAKALLPKIIKRYQHKINKKSHKS